MAPASRVAVIASEAKQSPASCAHPSRLRRRCAPRNDGVWDLRRPVQEAVDAVLAGGALDLALAGEVVEVGERLAEREGGLVLVELPAEHDRQQLGGAVRPLAGGDDL